MDFENEKQQEKNSAQELTGSRDGYQKDFRPVGRSPRPRIHTGQRPVSTGYERNSFNKHTSDDEGGFRPEGFGAGLQGQNPQRSNYRPRPANAYQQRQGGFQQRQGGYRPRFNQEDGEQGG